MARFRPLFEVLHALPSVRLCERLQRLERVAVDLSTIKGFRGCPNKLHFLRRNALLADFSVSGKNQAFAAIPPLYGYFFLLVRVIEITLFHAFRRRPTIP